MLTMTLKYYLDTERWMDQADTHPWFFPIAPCFINIYFCLLGDWNLGVFTRGLELGGLSRRRSNEKKRQQTGQTSFHSHLYVQNSNIPAKQHFCWVNLDLFDLHLLCIKATDRASGHSSPCINLWYIFKALIHSFCFPWWWRLVQSMQLLLYFCFLVVGLGIS